MTMGNDDKACPCGSGEAFTQCCRLLLSGEKQAKTAERLMRSRYTAYVVGDAEYLQQTWHPAYVPGVIDFDDTTRWLGLKVVNCISGTEGDDEGIVEFVARYKVNGRAYRLHEVSQFEWYLGHWVYIKAIGEAG